MSPAEERASTRTSYQVAAASPAAEALSPSAGKSRQGAEPPPVARIVTLHVATGHRTRHVSKFSRNEELFVHTNSFPGADVASAHTTSRVIGMYRKFLVMIS